MRAGTLCAATLLLLVMVVGPAAIRFVPGADSDAAVMVAGDDDEE